MKVKLGHLKGIISEVIVTSLGDDPIQFDESISGNLKAAVLSALIGMAGNASAAPNLPGDTLTVMHDEMPSEPGDDGDVVIMVDENGDEHKFERLILFQLDGEDYVVLMLVDPGVPEEESLFLYLYEIDGDGNEIFTEIEDESKWEKVRQKAEELLSEED